jgi:hypothetical protein
MDIARGSRSRSKIGVIRAAPGNRIRMKSRAEHPPVQE